MSVDISESIMSKGELKEKLEQLGFVGIEKFYILIESTDKFCVEYRLKDRGTFRLTSSMRNNKVKVSSDAYKSYLLANKLVEFVANNMKAAYFLSDKNDQNSAMSVDFREVSQ